MNDQVNSETKHSSGERVEPPLDERDRCAVIECAFIAYVVDEMERYTTESGARVSPPILGLCADCGFPVYRSNVGDKGLYHYSPMHYQSAPLTCSFARLNAPERNTESVQG